MTTTNVLVKSALDYVYNEYPDFLFYVQRNDLEATLQTALDNAIPSDFTLSSSTPDFEAIVLQLTQELQANPVWLDILPSATGQTLLRNISAGISYLHMAIVRATQVAFLKPGTPKSSVYAMMNTLGVNPRRKIPAKIDVQITVPEHSGSYVIPKFTQFTIANQHFFNRNDIVYTQFDLYKNVTLVQGSYFEQSGTAAGNNYEKIEIGYENYMISDEDVYVSINDEYWPKSNTVVWQAGKKEKTFFVSTIETGNIELMFGNEIFGKKLNTGDDIKIVWFETSGKSVANIPTGTTFDMTLQAVPLDCVTLGNVYGYDDELDTNFYINNGPFIRSSEHGAVRRIDYPTVACKYPLIRDALFRGQAEIAPGKRNWMNIIEGTVLTSNGMTMLDADWDAFVAYMQKESVWQLEILRKDPTIIEIDIKAKAWCSSNSRLNEVKSALAAAVLDYTKPKRGSIGYSVFFSDLNDVLEGNVADSKVKDLADLVEYVTDIEITYTSGFDPSTLPEGSGITSDGIIADFFSYVAIRNVDIDAVYTPRRSLSGRRDLNIGSIT